MGIQLRRCIVCQSRQTTHSSQVCYVCRDAGKRREVTQCDRCGREATYLRADPSYPRDDVCTICYTAGRQQVDEEIDQVLSDSVEVYNERQ